jgi:cation transport ATPase
MSITAIPDRLRTEVIELHGSECLRCGVQCTWSGPTRLHIDHVIPEVCGGPTTLANLQVLCQGCNLNKGANTADYRTAEARAELARQKEAWEREEARRAAQAAAWNAEQEAREARRRERKAQRQEEEARRQERQARRDGRGVLRRTLTYPLALLPIGALLGLITYGWPGAIVASLTMYLTVYLVCVVLTLVFRLPSAIAKRIKRKPAEL